MTFNLIPPHDVLSRQCELADLDRIYKESARLLEMCHEQRGRMSGAFAIADAQITKYDPLRFFVLREGRIICNPVIKKHSSTTVDSEEFCYTFFYMEKPGIVQRWNVIEVDFEELIDGKFVAKKEKFTGKAARVWQHELNHLDAKYVYEVDFESLKKSEEAIPKINEAEIEPVIEPSK